MRINTETSVGIFVLGALAIFFYMTFQIGVFRLDTGSFRSHPVFFTDVSGLIPKSDVKVAGVKVGWVQGISLIEGADEYRAKATIMINKRYQLHSNASAIVRQDGLLGNKFLELNPGDSVLPTLKKGQPLGSLGQAPTSIDTLIQKFGRVADNIEDITESVKATVGGVDGRIELKETFKNINVAADKIANFSTIIDRIATRNEDDINAVVGDIREFARELRVGFPPLQEDIRRIANQLEVDVLPAFKDGIEKIAKVFDRDFGSVAGKLESTADAIEEAALQTRDGFRSIESVADKINEGKGLIGKLVNEDQTYQDLKVAVQGLKNYFSKIESLGIVFDCHVESMYRPAENFVFKDAKGYFDVRVHPNEDHFYLMQMVGSLKGSVKRTDVEIIKKDPNGVAYVLGDMNVDDNFKWAYPSKYEEIRRERDTFKYGFQFGKTFRELAFRFGLFENTFGLGVDYDLPFGNQNVRWVSSFEAFDFRGRDRLNDERPHLKWINRLFFLRNLYFDFGADDFISKHNSNMFMGAGIRFGDDDIKYFVSRLGLGGGGN
ncbi:MAG: phospholipid/cholesterol/gamma-HCH transport system substrate-binding protein [Alteromonas naphthalenivorans]|jgi:phospholipid/cholesterol/gamma-HCH transport system substrate-binding protein